MFQKTECLTNNVILTHSARATLIEGRPSLILSSVRDRIHSGWDLLTHPLYGNIQPFQQPFRSILIGFPDEHVPSDPDSLMLLEKAIELFSRAEPGSVSSRMDLKSMDDYALLDVYLMRDSLEKYGLWEIEHKSK